MPTLITMPKWGLTMQSGTVTEWIAAEGDAVSAGAPLLTVETEKAVNDVEAPADGVLLRIVAPAGAEVPVSGPVAILAAPGESVSDEELSALLAASGPAAVGVGGATGGAAAGGAAREARSAARDASGRVTASPAARKLAAELGVDLATVEATGPGGRITSDDIQRAATALASRAAEPVEMRLEAGAGGVGLHALLAGPNDAATRIVFLHGLGGSLSTWTAVLGDFASDARVAALDLPGHGKSDKPEADAFDYSVAGMATAVGDAIVEAGLAPAVMFGHSLGAAVAIQLALHRPKLVRGLVLINGAGFGTEINATLLDLVEGEPSRENARATLDLFFEDKRLVSNRAVDDMVLNRTGPGADTAQKAVATAAFAREGQRIGLVERLGEVTTPTYIIWGESDRVIPVGHAAKAAEAIKGSWLDVIPSVGHVPQIEAAATVSALVRHWFTRLPAPDPEAEAPSEDSAAAPPVALDEDAVAAEAAPVAAAPVAAAPVEEIQPQSATEPSSPSDSASVAEDGKTGEPAPA
jgi:pyruvate dehydrogenase E2 component (dihydrolipoamide acetyltransferase)